MDRKMVKTRTGTDRRKKVFGNAGYEVGILLVASGVWGFHILRAGDYFGPVGGVIRVFQRRGQRRHGTNHSSRNIVFLGLPAQ